MANYKSVTIMGDEGWTILSGEGAQEDTTALLTRVAWPYRAIQLIGETTSAIPFIIADPRGNEYDSTQDWQNKIGFWPSPQKDLYKIAASMVALGCGYLRVMHKPNSKRINGLQYVPADQVSPLYTPDIEQKFIGFKVGREKLPIEDIIYFWYADYHVDNTHPPVAWPARSAFSAAGVLYNLDEFVARYFANGAVKSMLLGVPANTQQAERERVEGFFNKFLTGIKNAWRVKTINADDVKPVVIGGGLDELADQTLTDGQKTDICVAFGVPKTRLFSDASTNATADADVRSMTTDTALPLLNQIIEALNEQLFARFGLHMVEQHESMEIYQQDEVDSASALSQYVNAFNANLELAVNLAPMLGIEIPDDVLAALNKMIEEKNAKPEPPVVIETPAEPEPPEPDEEPEDEPMQAETRTALRNWQRRAVRLFEKGEPCGAPFEHESISTELHDSIMAKLLQCETADEIRTVFADVRPTTAYKHATPTDVIEILKLSIEAMKHG